MSEKVETMPDKALLTGAVEQISCEECFENYLFHMKNKNHEFTIGLIDILNCVKFAEEQGALPEIPGDWWIEVKSHYRL